MDTIGHVGMFARNLQTQQTTCLPLSHKAIELLYLLSTFNRYIKTFLCLAPQIEMYVLPYSYWINSQEKFFLHGSLSVSHTVWASEQGVLRNAAKINSKILGGGLNTKTTKHFTIINTLPCSLSDDCNLVPPLKLESLVKVHELM